MCGVIYLLCIVMLRREAKAVKDYLKDIKSADVKDLPRIAQEIREQIIDTVSKNGGHLASNLGMVEATISLHRVFSSPNDRLIFDVGHQAYAHKIITQKERNISFDTLRTYGGASGFTSASESIHDSFFAGHSGTSISSALGIAEANRLNGDDSYTIAIIGDGSFTNGMAYEALNNASARGLRLIILVNDNEMSISQNVGGLAKYLSKIRVSRGYFRFKRGAKRIGFFPLLGKPFVRLFAWIKSKIRRAFMGSTIFENLGLDYIGPVDGNNIKALINVLEEAKKRGGPCVVHMKTKKGLGYIHSECEPSKYHGIGAFDIESGQAFGKAKQTYSSKAGEMVVSLARDDEKICAITAAMADGTGLSGFEKEFPTRFFDVGIAEEHAVTFAAGLAKRGMKPVLALYSTFAQRSYDQALHDISLQKLPLTLLLDRCGVVEGDGVTHQGIFDYHLFSSVPNTRIYSPSTFEELRSVISLSINGSCLSVVRYPKGEEAACDFEREMVYDSGHMLYYSKGIEQATRVIITYGRMASVASEALKNLPSDIGIIRMVKIFPLDKEYLISLLSNKTLVYTLEEIYENGCVGEKIASYLAGTSTSVIIKAIGDFVPHGALSELYSALKLTPDDVVNDIKNFK